MGEAQSLNDLDTAKAHEILRDLVRVFEGLTENAQAFMAGVARSLELQQADATALVAYKRRLIDYLERFMGDLIRRSDAIARTLNELSAAIDYVLRQVAAREARDAAPDGNGEQEEETQRRQDIWRERWKGLRGWFLATGNEPPQAELLRARARSAIPQLQRPVGRFPSAGTMVCCMRQRRRCSSSCACSLRATASTPLLA